MCTQEEKEEKNLEPVSMYNIAAKLFAHVAKAVIDKYGEEACETIKDGVNAFGEERGREIARRAAVMGESNKIDNYLKNYDMARSELFEYETIFKNQKIEQNFTKCVFAEQWQNDGMEEYGILYCEAVDPAIARGFNENLEVIHDKHFFKDGSCHFCFYMKSDIDK
ncbi:L-2-amino-thiazoline-4-carboxylic acid hydrolase [Clostridium aminobutyricum]|nr:L-2-amino-thiazoline-4-carboxylic acid hydrolase [Clostridium aminobutyricum]